MLWAGSEDGNFVAYINRWSEVMPQPNDLSRSLVPRERDESPGPKLSSDRIHRNDAETLISGGQQKIASDDCEPDWDKDDQKAQQRLVMDRIHVEDEERGDAAEDEGCNHTESKSETRLR
jgi:hypothetical protein